MDCGNGGHHKNNKQIKISRMTICGIFLFGDIGKSNSAGTNVGADGTA